MAETGSIELKRHYRQLPMEEIDELVSAVADLVVDFLKKRHDPVQPDKSKQEQEVLA
ncbi:MAG: hypothetical protein M1377_03355 [Deltaproteobacteria bacterium]|nr:hypothetical protein [Deltaproteobacteria bacterium]